MEAKIRGALVALEHPVFSPPLDVYFPNFPLLHICLVYSYYKYSILLGGSAHDSVHLGDLPDPPDQHGDDDSEGQVRVATFQSRGGGGVS